MVWDAALTLVVRVCSIWPIKSRVAPAGFAVSLAPDASAEEALMKTWGVLAMMLLSLGVPPAFGATETQDHGPKNAIWIAKNFKFHTGEVMPELRLGYTTLGNPSGQPVLILHGTGGT